MLELIILYCLIGYLIALGRGEITGGNLASARASVKAPITATKDAWNKFTAL